MTPSCRGIPYNGFAVQRAALILGTALSLGLGHAACQEYSVKAVAVDSGKPLSGIPITLRYDCTYAGKARCKFIQRKTGSDGLAHLPEAGSLRDIDDIFSSPIGESHVPNTLLGYLPQ